MKRNSGRSRTLSPQPEREYLLKGLIRCFHCGLPMWAQTYNNGNRYYREQRGSRGSGYCVGRSGSVPCHIPDQQIGHIIESPVLPESWLDRVLAQVHVADEVKKVQDRRLKTEQRLRRLGQVYMDQLIEEPEYRRQKRLLEEQLQSLTIPKEDAATNAGKLLEDLPRLWQQADLGERRRLLVAMLDAVYVDTVEQKSAVSIQPKPAFVPLFDILAEEEPGCCPEPEKNCLRELVTTQRQLVRVFGGDGGESNYT